MPESDSTNTPIPSGFTLVEMMVSMSVLTILFAGLFATSLQTRLSAENNLYEMTAANAALSALEQTKASEFNILRSPFSDSDGVPSFNLIVNSDTQISLKVGQPNVVSVPIITRSDRSIQKELDVTLTPSFIESSTITTDLSGAISPSGIWVQMDYSWQHPRSGKTYQDSFTTMVSLVSTF